MGYDFLGIKEKGRSVAKVKLSYRNSGNYSICGTLLANFSTNHNAFLLYDFLKNRQLLLTE